MRCVLLFNLLQLADAETRLFVVFSGAPASDLLHRVRQSCVYEQEAARKLTQQCLHTITMVLTNDVVAVRIFKQQAGWQICAPLE